MTFWVTFNNTQYAAGALRPSTTHPLEWEEPHRQLTCARLTPLAQSPLPLRTLTWAIFLNWGEGGCAHAFSPYNLDFLSFHTYKTCSLTRSNKDSKRSSLISFPEFSWNYPKLQSIKTSSKAYLQLQHKVSSNATICWTFPLTLSRSSRHNVHSFFPSLPLCLPNSSFNLCVPDLNLNNNSYITHSMQVLPKLYLLPKGL